MPDDKGETKFFHVLYDYLHATWNVKIDDYKTSVFTNKDKDKCIAEAKRLAQESTAPKRRVLIRGTNGVVLEQVDYDSNLIA
ncbi:MAG TPA: DUF2188 domain-containing protein [Agitococcus sp.]|nr:DUF2188 domain-containing protein [Agitococcus sp.]